MTGMTGSVRYNLKWNFIPAFPRGGKARLSIVTRQSYYDHFRPLKSCGARRVKRTVRWTVRRNLGERFIIATCQGDTTDSVPLWLFCYFFRHLKKVVLRKDTLSVILTILKVSYLFHAGDSARGVPPRSEWRGGRKLHVRFWLCLTVCIFVFSRGSSRSRVSLALWMTG